jgi:hypothetical protein
VAFSSPSGHSITSQRGGCSASFLVPEPATFTRRKQKRDDILPLLPTRYVTRRNALRPDSTPGAFGLRLSRSRRPRLSGRHTFSLPCTATAKSFRWTRRTRGTAPPSRAPIQRARRFLKARPARRDRSSRSPARSSSRSRRRRGCELRCAAPRRTPRSRADRARSRRDLLVLGGDARAHADLAVARLSQRAAVRTLHTGRVFFPAWGSPCRRRPKPRRRRVSRVQQSPGERRKCAQRDHPRPSSRESRGGCHVAAWLPRGSPPRARRWARSSCADCCPGSPPRTSRSVRVAAVFAAAPPPSPSAPRTALRSLCLRASPFVMPQPSIAAPRSDAAPRILQTKSRIQTTWNHRGFNVGHAAHEGRKSGSGAGCPYPPAEQTLQETGPGRPSAVGWRQYPATAQTTDSAKRAAAITRRLETLVVVVGILLRKVGAAQREAGHAHPRVGSHRACRRSS